MSILHSQLTIYGAIDELVIEARKHKQGDRDKKLLATAARLLPNTTGFGEAGWHRELRGFFSDARVRGSSDVTFPSLTEATAELRAVPPPESPPAPRRESEPDQQTAFAQRPTPEREPVRRNPNTPGGFEDQTFYDSAYDPALARAGYGAFVLTKLAAISQWDQLDAHMDDLTAVMAVAVGAFHVADSATDSTATVSNILSAAGNVESRQDWVKVLTENGVDSRFGQASRPCFGSLQQINGRYCSTVVTDTSDGDLSVADVERIIDPMNWSICSKFFCKMTQNNPPRNTDRWSRIQERIGAECGEYGLSTDLIFYKARQPDGSIFINYDIDPQRHGDDPYVEVDNGYLWVSPLTADEPTVKGVRIRTSKQEHVQGLSPCATAALACLMGWGDAGREMLAGTARRLIAADAAGTPFYPLTQFVESRLQDP